MYFGDDSPRKSAMAVAALKQKFEPELKTFHATMLVTRAEEWCVEAESAEEARELLAAGQEHQRRSQERGFDDGEHGRNPLVMSSSR
jgi:hypothetical protein